MINMELLVAMGIRVSCAIAVLKTPIYNTIDLGKVNAPYVPTSLLILLE